MFKTIYECRLDLISNTVLRDNKGEATYDAEEADFMPCSAARVSFGNEDKTGDDKAKDVKLMTYLAEHKHMTPFEYQHATILIECPLFIRSQIHRHRSFSYNEISRRYTDENLEFWIPDKFRGQHKSSKQASSDEAVETTVDLTWYAGIALGAYEKMIEDGVAREIARSILPQSLLTKFYMGGNLRSWAHFIELRRDPHAQLEVQVIAERIAEELRKLWPESCTALGI